MVGFDYEKLVKATESFSPSRLIGKGSHGCVYKGVLQDSKIVAVKRSSLLLDGSDQVANHDNLKKLDNEIGVLSSLRENPYVINFVGASQDSAKNDKLMVMEFMPNGSLHNLLHVSATPPPWPKRVEIALQIARAVQFLHESNPLVIHRDIKSANILFDSFWNARLADFGLAVVEADSSGRASQPAGTMGYLDPCYTTPSKLSTKNDVFSLGVLLLEIISCRKVIDVSRAPASIVEWAVPLIQKQRIMEACDGRVALPACMEGTISHMLRVAARCVSSDEEKRPSIGEIVMEMEIGFVERVKIPIWVSILRAVVLMRRRRKLAKRCRAALATQQSINVSCDISTARKLLALHQK